MFQLDFFFWVFFLRNFLMLICYTAKDRLYFTSTRQNILFHYRAVRLQLTQIVFYLKITSFIR